MAKLLITFFRVLTQDKMLSRPVKPLFERDRYDAVAEFKKHVEDVLPRYRETSDSSGGSYEPDAPIETV